MLMDTKIRQAKARAKPYKLADKEGMYLFLCPTGSKSFRYDHRIPGRKTVTYGLYPDIGLEDAREQHRAARKLVAKGISPAQHKKAQKKAKRFAAANTVQALGEAWYSDLVAHRSESWKNNTRRWLEDIYVPDEGPVLPANAGSQDRAQHP